MVLFSTSVHTWSVSAHVHAGTDLNLSPRSYYSILLLVCSVPGRTLDIICKGAIWYGVELKFRLLILSTTFVLIPCQCAGMQLFRHAARWDGVEFKFWLLILPVWYILSCGPVISHQVMSPDYTSICIHCITSTTTTTTSITSIFPANTIANTIIVSFTTVPDCTNILYDSKRDIAPQRHKITTSLRRSLH